MSGSGNRTHAHENHRPAPAGFPAGWRRHTFPTNLARSGVQPKVAQALARHSTIRLTMDLYTHTVLDEQSAALDKLPDLDSTELGTTWNDLL